MQHVGLLGCNIVEILASRSNHTYGSNSDFHLFFSWKIGEKAWYQQTSSQTVLAILGWRCPTKWKTRWPSGYSIHTAWNLGTLELGNQSEPIACLCKTLELGNQSEPIQFLFSLRSFHWGTSCWTDEDMIGRVSRTARHCLHSARLCYRTLSRVLLSYRREWDRARQIRT